MSKMEVLHGYDWIEKSSIVSATQLTEPKQVKTAIGIRQAQATDWIVRDIFGKARVVHDKEFHERYEKIWNKVPMDRISKVEKGY